MNKNNYSTPEELHGSAINYTRIDDQGKMWVGNEEYESQVNYCPITGEPAPVQMKLKTKEHINDKGVIKIFKEYINE